MEQRYKIRRRYDGLFSTGGSYPDFHSVGKTWRRTGDVSRHMTELYKNRRDSNVADLYEHCDIVEYNLVEVGHVDIRQHANQARQRKIDQLAARVRFKQGEKERQERNEYIRLKAKYETD